MITSNYYVMSCEIQDELSKLLKVKVNPNNLEAVGAIKQEYLYLRLMLANAENPTHEVN